MGTSVSRDLVKFLDVSDNLYIQAYQTRRFTTLSERFTKEAIIAINSRLIASNGIRYFATKKYRNNTWELIGDMGNTIEVKKTQLYKDIHISLFRTIKASANYEETWTVERGGKYGYTVTAISQEVYI